jgi:hypothetical protein
MGWLKAFLSAVGSFFRFLGDRQLLDAGGAKQAQKELKEVEDRVEKAKTASSVSDPERDVRLRKKYDRAAGRK